MTVLSRYIYKSSDGSSQVNVAEDEVEKALIAFSMLRTCEEEATAIEALKLIEDALTQAQQARVFCMVFADL